jgi:F-type H+-transporting ATPase subunit a
MIRTPSARLLSLALALALTGAAVGAQEHKAETKAPAAAATAANPAPAQEKQEPAKKKDYIMPHVLNGPELMLPSTGHGFEREIHLPKWAPIHIGPLTLDLSPTKHVVMLWVAASLLVIVMLLAASGAKKARAEGRPASGLAGAIEAMVLYLRSDVILPNVGHHGEKYVPYCLSAFFLILFCNLLGLFPYMATATGNISVTATLAILSFIMIEVAGMRALGTGYINTIIWWPHDLPIAVKAPVSLIMTPVEILGKFTKPFALAMRLFANMTAGHIAVLALIGMIFTFAQLLNYSPASYGAALIPVALSTAIMGLEVFVAFLQAFIFMLLTAVFIGQIRESHH